MLLMLDDAKETRPGIQGGETRGDIQGDKQTFIIGSPLGTQRTLNLMRLIPYITSFGYSSFVCIQTQDTSF